MYNLKSLVGKVVTIKSHKGDEIVAKLMGYNEDGSILTIHYPKIVVIAGDTIALIPFALTAKTDEIFLNTNQLFTVMLTNKITASEYLELISDEVELEESPDDLEEAEISEA